MKHSNFFKSLFEDNFNEEDSLHLPQVDSESFEIICEFMQLYKDKDVPKI